MLVTVLVAALLALAALVVLVAVTRSGSDRVQRVRRADLRLARQQAVTAVEERDAERRFIEKLREDIWSLRDASPVCDALLGEIREHTTDRGNGPQNKEIDQ